MSPSTTTPTCQVPWTLGSQDRVLEGQHCPNPAYVRVRDAAGTEADWCEAHWQYGLKASGGAIRGVALVEGGKRA